MRTQSPNEEGEFVPGFGGNRRAEEHQIEIAVAKAFDGLPDGACGFDDVSGGSQG